MISYSLNDSFWSPRLAALNRATLPQQWAAMESTGRIDNFRRAAGRIEGEHQGFVFNDSDVYKWLEAAARVGYPGEQVDELVELILAAQGADGYLNTSFMFADAPERWSNIRDKHELYCAGHFIEAALALNMRGDERLMPAATRFADLICSLFGPEDAGKRPVVPGHEEIEIALVALYRATGAVRYLEQARYFLDARGHGLIGGLAYHQDHRPYRDLDKMDGHAVRALYLNIAAADLYLETGDPAMTAHLALAGFGFGLLVGSPDVLDVECGQHDSFGIPEGDGVSFRDSVGELLGHIEGHRDRPESPVLETHRVTN